MGEYASADREFRRSDQHKRACANPGSFGAYFRWIGDAGSSPRMDDTFYRSGLGCNHLADAVAKSVLPVSGAIDSVFGNWSNDGFR